jgi:hypothetical protein
MAQTNSVFSLAFSAIRRRPLTLWFAAAWPYLILALVCASIAVSVRANQGNGPQINIMERFNTMGYGEKLAWIFAFIVTISVPPDLAASAVSFLILTEHHGQKSTLRAYFRRLTKVILPLLALSISLGCIVVFAGMFLVIPGLLLAALTAFVIPTLVIEDISMGGAFRKGLRLSADNLGKLLPIYLMIAIVLALAWFLSIFVKVQADDQNWWVGLASFWVVCVIAWSGAMMIRSAWVTCLLVQVHGKSQVPPEMLNTGVSKGKQEGV